MQMLKIDTSGMACPQPVLMTKKALEENSEGAQIIVDNNVAKNNVERFLKNAGYNITLTEEEDVFIIEASK